MTKHLMEQKQKKMIEIKFARRHVLYGNRWILAFKINIKNRSQFYHITQTDTARK